MSRLKDKHAIITGGAQGQGAAIARAFVGEGARLVIADVADDAGSALAEELGDAAYFSHHDVSDPDVLGPAGGRRPRSGSARR